MNDYRKFPLPPGLREATVRLRPLPSNDQKAVQLAGEPDRPPLRPEDRQRLRSIRDEIQDLLLGGGWWTLSELHEALGRSGEASISARLRELRKWFIVEKRLRHANRRGLYEYRLLVFNHEANGEQR